jgi:MFS family permease
MLSLGFAFFSILVHIVIHATDFDIPVAKAVNVLSVVGGVSLGGRVMVGMAADRIGNKRILVICLILMSAALFWLLTAGELWMLYLFACIFGLGYGAFVVESPMIAELFGMKSHGALMGFAETGVVIGGTIGPILTGYIYDITNSYQLGFLINGVMVVSGLIMALLIKPITIEREKK